MQKMREDMDEGLAVVSHHMDAYEERMCTMVSHFSIAQKEKPISTPSRLS